MTTTRHRRVAPTAACVATLTLGALALTAPAGAETAPAPGMSALVQADGAAPAPAAPTPEQNAQLLAETAGRLAAVLEENDRLRGEVADLTQDRAQAQARVQDLTGRLQQRTLMTGAGIGLGAFLLGLLFGRLGGRRRRGGF